MPQIGDVPKTKVGQLATAICLQIASFEASVEECRDNPENKLRPCAEPIANMLKEFANNAIPEHKAILATLDLIRTMMPPEIFISYCSECLRCLPAFVEISKKHAENFHQKAMKIAAESLASYMFRGKTDEDVLAAGKQEFIKRTAEVADQVMVETWEDIVAALSFELTMKQTDYETERAHILRDHTVSIDERDQRLVELKNKFKFN